METSIHNALDWAPALRLKTLRGEYVVRRAPATDAVLTAWRANARAHAKLGYALVRERSGCIFLEEWKLPGADEIDALARIRAMSRAVDSDFEPPSPVGLRFYGYQKAGIAFAWERKGALIGDEMGLGKTLQAIGVANLMHARESVRWIVVTTLAGLKINWSRELARWLTFEAEVLIAEGSPKAPLQSLFTTSHARVLIINYDLLPRWSVQLLGQPWDLYVADEAHSMKNPKSKRSQVGLAINARRKVFLDGTPLENKPADLWPLIHALQPQRFQNFFKYAKRYCDAKQKVIGRKQDEKEPRKVWDFSGASHLAELNAELRAHVMVRRLKREVLPELPKKQRQVIVLPADCADADDELGLFVAAEHRLASLRIAVEKAKLGDDLKAYTQALKQLDEGVDTAFHRMAKQRQRTGLAKLPMAILHLRELLETGQKVLCFAHHHEVTDRLMREFKDCAVLIRGDMPMGERQISVDRFQNDPAAQLCVASIRAAGTGLNLTAATVVVFVELDFVPAIMAQAEDRAHRIGQTCSVLVQLLVLEYSLDSRIAEIIAEKLNIADQALDGKPPESVSVPWSLRLASEDAKPEQLAEEGAKLNPIQVSAIHRVLKRLAGLCDHGRSYDRAGFNTLDAPIGHDLAERESLSPKQAALGLRLVRRYHRQVPADLFAECVEIAPLSTSSTDAQGLLRFETVPLLKASA